MRFLPLLALPALAWLLPSVLEKNTDNFSPEKINLALRRTADGLLRAAGDTTSRIPAVARLNEDTWRVQLDVDSVGYDRLPNLLQAAFDMHGIRQTYLVALRSCGDATIDLGYHQLDLSPDGNVPCKGRALEAGCYFIEVTFTGRNESRQWGKAQAALVGLFLGGLGVFWFFRRKRTPPVAAPEVAESPGLVFGNSRLDFSGQTLECGGQRQTLTFREAKLLRLFAENPNRLLEREFILREVWADEGVLVGRSVDVFVSRLRKKLATDPTLGIVAVHGVGYRLEVAG